MEKEYLLYQKASAEYKELIMRNGDRIPVARGSVEKILEGIAAYWNSEK